MVNVLFVCTANIARSPYAERRLVHLVPDSVVVGSAGIPGYPGRPMDGPMAALLEEHGIAGDGHVSRVLTDELLADADLVLTMALAHHTGILDRWPHARHKVFGLQQFADALTRVTETAWEPPEDLVAAARSESRPDSMTWDVPDPYRRGKRAARKAAAIIDAAVEQVADALARPRRAL